MKKLNLVWSLAILLFLAGCCSSKPKTKDAFAVNPHRAPVVPDGYLVHRVSEDMGQKLLEAPWDDIMWSTAETLTLQNFLPESKFYGVEIQGKLLHDGKCIYAIFHTENDRFVYATRFQNNTDVCRDTCVEFFFQPQGAKWYGNCEFSLTGAYLTQFHPDAQNPWLNHRFLAPEHQALVETYSNFRCIVAPERTVPTEWTIAYKVPMAAYEPYGGPIGELGGQKFMANFYHCADASSHPRWVTWAPVPVLSFHLPECFLEITFE
ncbi:MAG: hypothetical protein J6Y80_06920 [Victivallales bacterium]|nr:hypothetical protein [Victivallales bacterium]